MSVRTSNFKKNLYPAVIYFFKVKKETRTAMISSFCYFFLLTLKTDFPHCSGANAQVNTGWVCSC